jgi:hypothetical protein
MKDVSELRGGCHEPQPEVLENGDSRQQVTAFAAGNEPIDPTVPFEPLDAATTGGERAARS